MSTIDRREGTTFHGDWRDVVVPLRGSKQGIVGNELLWSDIHRASLSIGDIFHDVGLDEAMFAFKKMRYHADKAYKALKAHKEETK